MTRFSVLPPSVVFVAFLRFCRNECSDAYVLCSASKIIKTKEPRGRRANGPPDRRHQAPVPLETLINLNPQKQQHQASLSIVGVPDICLQSQYSRPKRFVNFSLVKLSGLRYCVRRGGPKRSSFLECTGGGALLQMRMKN